LASSLFNCLSDKQFNGIDYSKDENTELRKLRRKNTALERGLAFLKKSVLYEPARVKYALIREYLVFPDLGIIGDVIALRVRETNGENSLSGRY